MTETAQPTAPGASWQASKSGATRLRILEATTECLAEMPCSEVSTTVICERSGVSRGGVQHHFPTRSQLLQAAIEHLNQRRLEAYRRDLETVPDDVAVTDHIVATHWKNLNAPAFRAYQELVVAARSDESLKQTLATHYRAFIQEWLEISFDSFGWRSSSPEVMRVGNIAQYLMDGMAYGQLAGQLTAEQVTELLDHVRALMRDGVARSASKDRRAPEISRAGSKPLR